jgi:hypothetical protein
MKKPAGPPVSSVSPEEELWVIQKASAIDAADPNQPRSGALMAKLPDKKRPPPRPPQSTPTSKASIAGYIATVDVTQQ